MLAGRDSLDSEPSSAVEAHTDGKGALHVGMVFAGAAAALALSSRILGGRMDWADAFASWSPHELLGNSQGDAGKSGGGVQLGEGLGVHASGTSIGNRTPDEGGGVSGPPWHLEDRSVVGDVEHRVSPVCPHLGGIVNWNDTNESWECPLHASRFAPDGTLLEGPATRNLTAAQWPVTSASDAGVR